MIEKAQAEQIVSVIENSQNIVLFVHHNPDGDALGSAFGLRQILESQGKNITIVAPNELPTYLNFLNRYEEVLVTEKEEPLVIDQCNKADTYFFLDFNRRDRIGPVHAKISFEGKKIIMIDHHPYPEEFEGISISNTSVSSTAELMYYVIQDCGWTNYMNTEVASALYTGIVTDTGGFSHNCSNPETYYATGQLLESGIDRNMIYNRIFKSNTISRLKLLGHLLANRLTIYPEYNAAYIALKMEDKEQFDFQPGDSEGFVNYPLSVKGIKFCALFTESEDMIKVSLRSKGDFPANKFSETYYSGGGHLNAAGGRKQATLDSVIKDFENGLELFKTQLLQ